MKPNTFSIQVSIGQIKLIEPFELIELIWEIGQIGLPLVLNYRKPDLVFENFNCHCNSLVKLNLTSNCSSVTVLTSCAKKTTRIVKPKYWIRTILYAMWMMLK